MAPLTAIPERRAPHRGAEAPARGSRHEGHRTDPGTREGPPHHSVRRPLVRLLGPAADPVGQPPIWPRMPLGILAFLGIGPLGICILAGSALSR